MSLGAFAQVQQAPDYKPMVCEMTDFVITLDGIEGDTYHIKAKPINQAFYNLDIFRSNSNGFQYQWVPTMYVGPGTKALCASDLYPNILSQTLKVNIREFSSRNLAQDNAVSPDKAWKTLKKGVLYNLNLVLKNPFCDCMSSKTAHAFRLNSANQLEVCKISSSETPKQ
ncbi:MAG TPA: hypothetical protein DCM71_26355 [Runella sp.]|nr:hypothetical protein [Runella sp.]